MQSPTIGIEEELFLVDPETRQSSPRSGRVLGQLVDGRRAGDADDLDRELFQHQVETKTPPVATAAELREALVAGRRRVAEVAAGVGLVTMASGTVPTANPDPRVTPQHRYLDMAGRFGEIARPAGTCGMHVHVEVPSPAVGVRVIDELVPWLPVVLAASANSPFHQGRDTAYSSWRSQIWAQWPSAGPTERFGSLAAYRRVSERLIASGAARDEGMLYFDARLSVDHPTVEVRISDVCTSVDDAVLIAVLLRALVSRTLRLSEQTSDDDERRAAGRAATYGWRAEMLRAAQWRAARYGLSDRLLDPTDGELVAVGTVLGRLVDTVRPELEESGEVDLVDDGLRRMRSTGGAPRQRAALERTGELAAVVDDLVTRTHESWRR